MLRCANISLREGWFDVIQSKGPKTRRIYINDELADFLKNYNKKIEFFYPEREFFFPGYDSHKHLSEGFVTDNFHRFWKLAFPDFTGIFILELMISGTILHGRTLIDGLQMEWMLMSCFHI